MVKSYQINSDTVCLRELNYSDYDRILEIVKDYALHSTAVLFISYMNHPSETMSADEKLGELFDLFYEMRKNSYYQENIEKLRGEPHFATIKNQISQSDVYEQLKHFFPYGPILPPLEESVKAYIEKALSMRKEPRNYFRMGIEHGNKLIGCFVFDFIEIQLNGYRVIGDPGIFIDPEYILLPDNDAKCWREVFYVAATFIKERFKFFFPDNHENIYVYATTHPLNIQTDRILQNFTELGTTNKPEYGVRKFSVMKYDKFISTFLDKEWGHRVLTTGVEINIKDSIDDIELMVG